MNPPTSSGAFTIDTLLLNGWIIDRGQLSLYQRTELDLRALAGKLIKTKEPGNRRTVYCVPGMECSIKD